MPVQSRWATPLLFWVMLSAVMVPHVSSAQRLLHDTVPADVSSLSSAPCHKAIAAHLLMLQTAGSAHLSFSQPQRSSRSLAAAVTTLPVCVAALATEIMSGTSNATSQQQLSSIEASITSYVGRTNCLCDASDSSSEVLVAVFNMWLLPLLRDVQLQWQQTQPVSPAMQIIPMPYFHSAEDILGQMSNISNYTGLIVDAALGNAQDASVLPFAYYPLTGLSLPQSNRPPPAASPATFVPPKPRVQMLMWYRTDALEALGVVPPATWDDLIAVAVAINASIAASSGGSGGGAHWPPGSSNPVQYAVCIDTRPLCKGGPLLAAMLASLLQYQGPSQGYYFDPATMMPLVHNAAMSQALTWLAKLASLSLLPSKSTCNIVNGPFILGSCALTLDWATAYFAFNLSIATNMRGRLGVAQLPGSSVVLKDRVGTGAALEACSSTRECPWATAEPAMQLARAVGGDARSVSAQPSAIAGHALVNRAPFSAFANFTSALPFVSIASSAANLAFGQYSKYMMDAQNRFQEAVLYSLASAISSPASPAAPSPPPLQTASGGRRRLLQSSLSLTFDMQYWLALGYDGDNTQRFLNAMNAATEHPNAAPDITTPLASYFRTALDEAFVNVSDGQSTEQVMIALEGQYAAVLQVYGQTLEGKVGLFADVYQSSIGYGVNGSQHPPLPTAPHLPPSPPLPGTNGGNGSGSKSVTTQPWFIAIVVSSVLVLLFIVIVSVLVYRRNNLHRGFFGVLSPPGAGPETTLLVTDIQNSTVLWESLPVSVMDQSVKMHHMCIRKCALQQGGYESMTEGDSFIMAFHTAHDAMNFSIECQMALMELSWPLELLGHDEAKPVWVAHLDLLRRLNAAPSGRLPTMPQEQIPCMEDGRRSRTLTNEASNSMDSPTPQRIFNYQSSLTRSSSPFRAGSGAAAFALADQSEQMLRIAASPPLTPRITEEASLSFLGLQSFLSNIPSTSQRQPSPLAGQQQQVGLQQGGQRPSSQAGHAGSVTLVLDKATAATAGEPEMPVFTAADFCSRPGGLAMTTEDVDSPRSQDRFMAENASDSAGGESGHGGVRASMSIQLGDHSGSSRGGKRTPEPFQVSAPSTPPIPDSAPRSGGGTEKRSYRDMLRQVLGGIKYVSRTTSSITLRLKISDHALPSPVGDTGSPSAADDSVHAVVNFYQAGQHASRFNPQDHTDFQYAQRSPPHMNHMDEVEENEAGDADTNHRGSGNAGGGGGWDEGQQQQQQRPPLQADVSCKNGTLILQETGTMGLGGLEAASAAAKQLAAPPRRPSPPPHQHHLQDSERSSGDDPLKLQVTVAHSAINSVSKMARHMLSLTLGDDGSDRSTTRSRASPSEIVAMFTAQLQSCFNRGGGVPAEALASLQGGELGMLADSSGNRCMSWSECVQALWQPVESQELARIINMQEADGALLIFCGLRVRMGMHSGIDSAADVSTNRASGRMQYGGDIIKKARQVSDAARGGMVLCSGETFAQLPLRKFENKALIVYAGDHVLSDSLGPGALHVLYQGVPSSIHPRLVYLDGVRSTVRVGKDTLSAPVGYVTICFMYVVGAQVLLQELGAAAKEAMELFRTECCQELMLVDGYLVEAADGFLLTAFHHPADALLWSLRCQQSMLKLPWPPQLLAHELAEEIFTYIPSPSRSPQAGRGTVSRRNTVRSGLINSRFSRSSMQSVSMDEDGAPDRDSPDREALMGTLRSAASQPSLVHLLPKLSRQSCPQHEQLQPPPGGGNATASPSNVTSQQSVPTKESTAKSNLTNLSTSSVAAASVAASASALNIARMGNIPRSAITSLRNIPVGQPLTSNAAVVNKAHHLAAPVSFRRANSGTLLVKQVVCRGLRLKAGCDVGLISPEVSSMTGRMVYRGRVMNRAARIASRATAGHVLTTGTVWTCAQASPAIETFGISANSNGLFTLKGVAEQMELFDCRFNEPVRPTIIRRSQASGGGNG